MGVSRARLHPMKGLTSATGLLQALIRIPSVNPAGHPGTESTGEQRCAEFVAAFLEEIGARRGSAGSPAAPAQCHRPFPQRSPRQAAHPFRAAYRYGQRRGHDHRPVWRRTAGGPDLGPGSERYQRLDGGDALGAVGRAGAAGGAEPRNLVRRPCRRGSRAARRARPGGRGALRFRHRRRTHGSASGLHPQRMFQSAAWHQGSGGSRVPPENPAKTRSTKWPRRFAFIRQKLFPSCGGTAIRCWGIRR